MTFQLEVVESENKKVVCYAIIIAVIFFVFILPRLERKFAQEQNQIKEKMESLKGGNILKLDKNKCSRDCCLHTQWPAPHMPHKKSGKYVGTNFMCNGGTGGGCLCVTEEDREFLAKRGHNFLPCQNKKPIINDICNNQKD
tara:strand:+ start:1708 stop:2130 length:423 start_codon:yes stop_codon:yes gene_type:complete